MEIISISPINETDWLDMRKLGLDFINRYGSRRYTREGVTRLQTMSLQEFQQPGTSMMAATVRGEHGRTPIGLSIVNLFGQAIFLVAIHPLYRNQRIGPSLILSQQSKLGYLCCKLSSDYYSGLHMCFDAGMHAIALESRLSGKPKLVMSLGSPDTARTIDDIDSDSTQEGELLCLSPS